MARIFWAALCVALFACVYSFPVRAQSCAPVAAHLESVKGSVGVIDTMTLEGDKLQRVIAYVQKINGDTAKYDTGYLAWSVQYVVLFLGNGGMICQAFPGDVRHLPALIEAAEGRPA